MVALPYEYEIGLWMKSGGIHYEPTFDTKMRQFLYQAAIWR